MKNLYQILFGTTLVLMTACGSEGSFPEVTHIPCCTPSSSIYYSLIGVDGTLICKDEIEGMPSVVVNGVVSVTKSPTFRRILGTDDLINLDVESMLNQLNSSDYTKLGPNDNAVSYYIVGKSLERINDTEYLDGGFCTEDLIPVVGKAQGITFIRKDGEVAFTFNEYKPRYTDHSWRVAAVNGYFSDGLCLYKADDGCYGYINTKGEPIINGYLYANPFNEGLAVVGGKVKDDGHGWDNHFEVINTKGEMVAQLDVAFDLNDVKPAIYSEGLLFFGGKVFNRKGEIAFRLSDKIEDLFPFCDGCAIFEDDNFDYGLIDKKGEIVVPAGAYDNAYLTKGRVYFTDYDCQTTCFDFNGNRIFQSEQTIVPVGKNRCVLEGRKDYYFTDYNGESIDNNSYDNIDVPADIYMPNLFLAYIYSDTSDYVKWVNSDYYDTDAAVESVLNKLNKTGVGSIKIGMSMTEWKDYCLKHPYEYGNNFRNVSMDGKLETNYHVELSGYEGDYSNQDAVVKHIFIHIDCDKVGVTDARTRIRQAILSYLDQIGFTFGGHNDDWMDETWDIYRSDQHDYLIAVNKDGSKLCLEAN